MVVRCRSARDRWRKVDGREFMVDTDLCLRDMWKEVVDERMRKEMVFVYRNVGRSKDPL